MKALIILLISGIATISFTQKPPCEIQIHSEWQNLLDKDLKNWEIFVGVPHISVDLEGYEKSENVHKGIPLGLNNDPKKVMSIVEADGELLLKISGEIYAGLTTLQEYGNYHLKAEFKWGEKKWEPRLELKRDNGILYHCKGEHGAFWHVWMQSLECQVQEEDMGDFVALVNVQADIASKETKEGFHQYIPGEKQKKPHGYGEPGYVHINQSNEKPHGEWNKIEVITLGNKSIHVVNGKVVMIVHNARHLVNSELVPLECGKIQIQSEGAEAYYKNIQIKSIQDFPKKYKRQADL